MSPWRLRQIARHLDKGALIAYPTDTIWGLGCHPYHESTVNRLLRLKQRSASKGLILLSSNPDFFQPLIKAEFWPAFLSAAAKPQDKPVTWLVPAASSCPGWLSGGSERIALRVAELRHVDLLCSAMQVPLVSTSANISGRTPARNSLQIHKHFQQKLDFIIEGFTTATQQASRICDLKSGEILRP